MESSRVHYDAKDTNLLSALCHIDELLTDFDSLSEEEQKEIIASSLCVMRTTDMSRFTQPASVWESGNDAVTVTFLG